MQSMRTEVKQVQSECNNSLKTLTKLDEQIGQLMSMIGDIKRQIDTRILSTTENNLRREGKKHVKAIELRLGKLLSRQENPNEEKKHETMNEIVETPLYDDTEVMINKVAPLMVEPERKDDVHKENKGTKFPFPKRLEEKRNKMAINLLVF